MKLLSSSLLTTGFLFGLIGCPGALARDLEIYFIDVVGGAATLIVTPAGESILVDTGWMRDDHRDSNRIYDALINRAKCSQIDYCITTHWHRDHFGGIGPLSERVPIERFYDRGVPESFSEDPEHYPIQMEAYLKACKGRNKTMNPGEEIPLKQLDGHPPIRLVCVAVNREVTPIGASKNANKVCEDAPLRERDNSDNANSIALLLSYGNFQFFNGGDITWNIEHKLVCPENKIGDIDLYMVNHHGFDISNNPVFLQSINPRVAVVCNGPTKGCTPKTIARLRALPEMQAIYQLHRNIRSSAQENTDPAYIANPDPEKSGIFVKATVPKEGGWFDVCIGENGQSRRFEVK